MNFLNKIFRNKKVDESKGRSQNPIDTEKVSVKEVKEIPKGTILGVIEYPHVTEKSSSAAGMNKYVFSVSGNANKPGIRGAVESRYGVRVGLVNLLNSPGKERVRGKQKGWRPGFKKAIVTLKKGESLDIIPK